MSTARNVGMAPERVRASSCSAISWPDWKRASGDFAIAFWIRRTSGSGTLGSSSCSGCGSSVMILNSSSVIWVPRNALRPATIS